MPTFLNRFGFLFALGLLVSIATGYMVNRWIDLTTHAILALVVVLGAILSLSLSMFYFIGTGSMVKEAALKKVVEAEDYYATRKFKGKLFPLTCGGILSLMVIPMLGAGYDAGKMPLIYHTLGAWVSLLVYYFVLTKIKALLTENEVIVSRAVERYGDKTPEEIAEIEEREKKEAEKEK